MEAILKRIFLIYFLIVFYESTTYCDARPDEPELTLVEGRIRGTFQKNYYNETTIAFLGVPYGSPPLGDRRFRAPDPVRPWKGIWDATRERGPCINRDTAYEDGKIVGEETCLVLNIYTKPDSKDSRRNLKPVMVFLNGVGFTIDTTSETILNPAFLLIEDVVVVVVSYRLGLAGFLSLEDSSLGVPGNAGLKDQVLALKWIQRNIETFGGDPRRVTLCGETAGAASVNYHILSPASRGLFQGAIALSGSALCPWALGTTNSRLVARAAGVPNATERQLLDILRNMTGYELLLLQEKIFDPIIYGTIRPFVPVVEEPSPDAIITKQPIDIIRSGDYNHVPIFWGYVSNEGILLDYLRRIEPVVAEEYNYTVAIPWFMHANEKQKQTIVDILRKTYSPLNNVLVRELLVMDSAILAPIAATAVNTFKTSRNVPIYTFRVAAETRRNFFKVTKQLQNEIGTANLDPIGFLWNAQGLPKPLPNTLEGLTVYRFVKLWTNFAKYGNPTPNDELGVILPPIDNINAFNTLEIGEKLQVLEDLPERDRIQVWREIYRQSRYTADYLY